MRGDQKKAEAAQRSGESLRPGHAVLGPVLFGRLTACDRPQRVYLSLMEPLHYDDLPKNSAECWELLGSANHADAITAFIEHGADKSGDDLTKFKKTLLKLTGASEIVRLFDAWPAERKISKTLEFIDRDKVTQFKGNFVRYWLLNHRRHRICAVLDAAGIPNESGYILEDYKVTTTETWLKGFAVLWEQEELFVRLYLGYVLIGTRRGKEDGIWTPLAVALGKGSPNPNALGKSLATSVEAPVVSSEVEVVNQAKPKKAEDSGEFLLYEQEIIKALARGAISRTDSLDAEDAIEMARQVIDDAPGRARVFFLLGFAQALHKRKADLSGINGINQDRISWLFAGYVQGLARQADLKAIVAFIKESAEMFKAFLANPRHPAFVQTHGFISQALADGEEAGHFCELASAGASVFGDVDRLSLLLQGSAMARELTGRRNYVEVLKLCTMLADPAERLARSKQPSFARFAVNALKGLKRREAIALLGKGDLEGARSAFGLLAAEGDSREKVEARAWIAMANAGLTDFFSVFPSQTREIFQRSGERMKAVLKEISDQRIEPSKLSQTVSACAGMAEYYLRNYPAALNHFRNAAEAIMQEGRPATSRAYLWIRFMRSASQLMNMDFSSPEVIVADFEAVGGSKIKPASWFYAELVEPAALFTDNRLLPLVLEAIPDEDREKHFLAYQNADLLSKDAQKRLAYAQWLPGSKRKKKDVFEQLCQVVRWDIKAGKVEAAEIAIDGLEQLAEESEEFAAGLLNLVSEQGVVPDVMEEATQLELRIRLLLRLKRDADAVQLMLERFRKAATSSNAWHREQSLELLAELKATEADLSQVSVIAAKLAAEFDSNNTGNDIIATAGKVRVIYVGGNEIQQRYEKDIVAELAVEHPNLTVDFEYPGWSSNWASVADGIKSRLGDYDGLVLSYFVRTIFGRTVRKMCTDSCPWWAAPGHGKASIKRGILAAARHAATRRPKAKG